MDRQNLTKCRMQQASEDTWRIIVGKVLRRDKKPFTRQVGISLRWDSTREPPLNLSVTRWSLCHVELMYLLCGCVGYRDSTHSYVAPSIYSFGERYVLFVAWLRGRFAMFYLVLFTWRMHLQKIPRNYCCWTSMCFSEWPNSPLWTWNWCASFLSRILQKWGFEVW